MERYTVRTGSISAKLICGVLLLVCSVLLLAGSCATLTRPLVWYGDAEEKSEQTEPRKRIPIPPTVQEFEGPRLGPDQHEE
jgi:hypothetical protein